MLALVLALGLQAHAGTLADCGEPAALQGAARTGRLSATQRTCVEDVLGSTSDRASREELSRTLIDDAYARGQRGLWVQLVERHLREIDQKDPEICYQYGLHLYQRAHKYEIAIEWANMALEHEYRWPEEQRPLKRYNAFALRTKAARALMGEAEAAWSKYAGQENRMLLNAAQSKARLYAIEWAKLAKELGKDPTEALDHCMATGWTQPDCEGAAAGESEKSWR